MLKGGSIVDGVYCNRLYFITVAFHYAVAFKVVFQVENEELSLHFGVLMFKFKLYPKEIEKAGEEATKDVEQGIEKEQQSVHSKTATAKSDIKSDKKNKSAQSSRKLQSGTKAFGTKERKTEERTWKETFFLIVDIIHSVVRPY